MVGDPRLESMGHFQSSANGDEKFNHATDCRATGPRFVIERENQNSQPNGFIFSRAISRCRLQAAATVFLSELAMSCFQVRAKASMFSLYSAFLASGTWSEIQALYLAMKSSHSGMPIFSLLPAVAA